MRDVRNLSLSASPRPDGRLERIRVDVSWAVLIAVATLILGTAAFGLAIGAERATPRPSELHLWVNRALAGSCMLALLAYGGASLVDRRHRRRAVLVLVSVIIVMVALSVAFILQQG
jgi:hypothetical protein